MAWLFAIPDGVPRRSAAAKQSRDIQHWPTPSRPLRTQLSLIVSVVWYLSFDGGPAASTVENPPAMFQDSRPLWCYTNVTSGQPVAAEVGQLGASRG
jgi:hypothetical protein